MEEIKQLFPQSRGESGVVKSVLVVGAKEEKEVSSALRSRLGGLRSSRFWVQPHYRDGEVVSFTFYGSGWGHSVGMDQVAVAGMADAGKDYKKILHHFYTDVEIKTEN
jgi:SpoIID/LytB domain protein